MDKPIKTTGSKIVYQNPWIRVREDSIRRQDGSDGIYGVIESGDSVCTVALNTATEICFVRVYRYPAQRWLWELPGGGGDGEDPIRASKRELLEETGLQSDSWYLLGTTRVSNGLLVEQQANTLALDVTQTANFKQEDEISDCQFFAITEVYDMISRGDINDGQSLTALYLYEQWLKQNKTS
jgi:8-oxo-dGTP pyrophosphatase MutT (NUDIX family)